MKGYFGMRYMSSADFIVAFICSFIIINVHTQWGVFGIIPANDTSTGSRTVQVLGLSVTVASCILPSIVKGKAIPVHTLWAPGG
jgi:hypothetical protein